MRTTIINEYNQEIVHVESDEMLITDVQSAIDFAMTVNYETGCTRIAIDKKRIREEFFVLSTGLAGDVFQKYTNYHIKMAIYGDFDYYTSKPLKDFIYESNKGNSFFFVPDYETAVEKLSLARG